MPIPLPSCCMLGRTAAEARTRLHRNFHTTAFLSADNTKQNHYSILGLSPSCAQSDIKKSFYKLSKAHHPDRNPDNREAASQKFAEISEAYHVLGTPEKRAKWDRENLPQESENRGRGGSFSSAGGYSGPGGRKATGLSKRRGQFRGPPPSFYRQGGWGNQSERQQQAHAKGQAAWSAASGQGASESQQANGSWPFGTDPNDVPHFNRDGHYRTQTTVAEQLKKGRQQRRKILGVDADEHFFTEEGPGDIISRFLTVGSLLLVGIGGPVLLLGFMK